MQAHEGICQEGKGKLLSSIFYRFTICFAVVPCILQLCFFFADVLKLCIIPTYNFADV